MNPRSSKPTPTPGHLNCFTCGAEFDPAQSKINGVRVAPSAFCKGCLKANLDAGRWQERLLLDAAKEK